MNKDDISTLHKRQTVDARGLCIYDINEKLTRPGEYDIGGTYTGTEPDLWFYFTTSYGPGNKRLFNLFVCLRKEGSFNIGISKSNESSKKTLDSARCCLSNELKWQVFKSSQPNEKFLLKTFFFSLKQFEADTLYIPVSIKSSPISPFNMDLIKQIKVNHDFGDLLSKQEKTNFSVQSSSGKQYQVHKIILAAHSPILRNMVKSETVSSIFLDINDNDMELLLEFLYTGSIKNILKQDCLNLLDIAGKFQLNNLFFLVQYAIAEQINLTNCMEIAVISERYKLVDLQNTVFKFIKENPGVFETDGWKNLDDVILAKKMFQYLHTNNIKV